jgi:mRNA-degrading endonuclease RelE of RelBE toxin-antitoxin system
VTHLSLRPRALQDLRRIGPGPDRKRITEALRLLQEDAPNLDVKQLQGYSPWLRLRVGDYRVLYLSTEDTYEVERIVHRRDLKRAVATLFPA